MPAPTPGLAFGSGLAFALVLAGSTAHAAPPHSASRQGHDAKRHVDPAPSRAVDRAAPDDEPAAPAARQVALESGSAPAPVDEPDAAPQIAKPARPARGWQVELGPYLWASSVNATVSFGPLSTGTEIGFIDLARHARYGAAALAEVRHGRFAVSGDFMYGASAITGSTSIASVMMTLAGNASSLLVDGAAGYQVLGDEDAVFSLEARTGVRYQRTAVSGTLGVAGFALQTPEIVDDAADAVVGARAVVRPVHSVFLSGLFDVGVFGSSDRTWSASVDAGLRVSSHVLLTAGWRTLTTERAYLRIELQGPRAALQLVF